MDKLSLNSQEHSLLKRLGVSKRATLLYEHLLRHGPMTAKEAAGFSEELPSAEYRLFKQLEELGLVRRENKRPIVFTALPKVVGLRAAYARSRLSLDQLASQTGLEVGKYHVEVIVGREALYRRYIELAEQSKREICIYAIGIAYSRALQRCQKEAIERGVRIRHVLQQLKPSNYHVAHKWSRLGVNVRHAPAERGFHLMLFDNRTALISFSDSQNTEDRLSMLTDNPAAVRLFAVDFQHIWSNARKVEV